MIVKDKKMEINIPKNLCFKLPGTSEGAQKMAPKAILKPISKLLKKETDTNTGIAIAKATKNALIK